MRHVVYCQSESVPHAVDVSTGSHPTAAAFASRLQVSIDPALALLSMQCILFVLRCHSAGAHTLASGTPERKVEDGVQAFCAGGDVKATVQQIMAGQRQEAPR